MYSDSFHTFITASHHRKKATRLWGNQQVHQSTVGDLEKKNHSSFFMWPLDYTINMFSDQDMGLQQSSKVTAAPRGKTDLSWNSPEPPEHRPEDRNVALYALPDILDALTHTSVDSQASALSPASTQTRKCKTTAVLLWLSDKFDSLAVERKSGQKPWIFCTLSHCAS